MVVHATTHNVDATTTCGTESLSKGVVQSVTHMANKGSDHSAQERIWQSKDNEEGLPNTK